MIHHHSPMLSNFRSRFLAASKRLAGEFPAIFLTFLRICFLISSTIFLFFRISVGPLVLRAGWIYNNNNFHVPAQEWGKSSNLFLVKSIFYLPLNSHLSFNNASSSTFLVAAAIPGANAEIKKLWFATSLQIHNIAVLVKV